MQGTYKFRATRKTYFFIFGVQLQARNLLIFRKPSKRKSADHNGMATDETEGSIPYQ
jgi:hypothetical protein